MAYFSEYGSEYFVINETILAYKISEEAWKRFYPKRWENYYHILSERDSGGYTNRTEIFVGPSDKVRSATSRDFEFFRCTEPPKKEIV
jgi:hypothetical protein